MEAEKREECVCVCVCVLCVCVCVGGGGGVCLAKRTIDPGQWVLHLGKRDLVYIKPSLRLGMNRHDRFQRNVRSTETRWIHRLYGCYSHAIKEHNF